MCRRSLDFLFVLRRPPNVDVIFEHLPPKLMAKANTVSVCQYGDELWVSFKDLQVGETMGMLILFSISRPDVWCSKVFNYGMWYADGGISNVNNAWLGHIARSNIKSRNVSRRSVQVIQYHIITTQENGRLLCKITWYAFVGPRADLAVQHQSQFVVWHCKFSTRLRTASDGDICKHLSHLVTSQLSWAEQGHFIQPYWISFWAILKWPLQNLGIFWPPRPHLLFTQPDSTFCRQHWDIFF